jgi:hypothetical protein
MGWVDPKYEQHIKEVFCDWEEKTLDVILALLERLQRKEKEGSEKKNESRN